MRNITLIILAIICNHATAQQHPIPTQFDTFINRPSVEWAAYASDTVRCTKLNISALLRDQFEKGEIKATFPLYRELGDGNDLFYRTPDEVKWSKYPLVGPMIDSAGNLAPINWDDYKPKNEFDSISYNLIFAEQVLFIEDGILRSYNPYISPAASIYSFGVLGLLGESKYFTSCFNFNYTFQLDKRNQISFFAQTKRKIKLDTIETENKLKELYGRNMLGTLWPYILKDKFDLFLAESNTKIKADEINSNSLKDLTLIEPLMVPIFDSLGNSTGKFVGSPITPNVFTTIELVQDWYYDHTKNLVFNTIKTAYLYALKKNARKNESSPILKIVFN